MANTFLMAERDCWPLWLAVALGAGAAGYFALPAEPPAALGWAALALGFGLAKLSEEAVATPVLDHAVVAHLTARIASLEPREKGVRVVLDEVRSGALSSLPRRIRVALRAGGDFRPGQWLSSALGIKHTYG
ncbi:MAG: hypothetical protein WCJ15_01700 [Alphaproteobacteria bacterium]